MAFLFSNMTKKHLEKIILMNNAEFLLFYTQKSYEKEFFEFEDVSSTRCYPLMETN
jgi:hypothetical protein